MRARVPRSRVTHERWLVSYADFITLLFGFFVVLYAFARADQKKQAEIPVAIDAAFKALGIFSDSTRSTPHDRKPMDGKDAAVIPMNIIMGEEVLSAAQVKSDLDNVRRDLQQRLSNEVAQHTVAIKMGRDGLVITLREAGFFESGSAKPRPETIATLRKVASALDHTPYDLRIEGHTDNIPIHSLEFDSNWELSTARATHIARALLDLHTIAAEHLSAAGYAEFHPVESNTTPAGRANNRRVDIIILPRSRIDLSATGIVAPSGTWRKITDSDPAIDNSESKSAPDPSRPDYRKR